MTFFVAFLVFILDRLTKLIILKVLAESQSINVLPGVFHITLVFNKGVAFGLFKDANFFFVPLSIAVILSIIFFVYKNKLIGLAVSAGLGLILGGALGNLTDRIRLGYVVDFLDFRVWPVFNIADSAITIGVGILLYKMLAQNIKHKA